ncbi:hypothetical protein JW826_04540 [Candidatus Woesearchaeota archaeon]|nr:hypothetical protein [Candidatus Woesearchaeota archaeon]
MIGATVLGAATLFGGFLYAGPAQAAENVKSTKPVATDVKSEDYKINPTCVQVSGAQSTTKDYTIAMSGGHIKMYESDNMTFCDPENAIAFDANGIGKNLALDALITSLDGKTHFKDATSSSNKTPYAFDLSPLNPKNDGLKPGKYLLFIAGEKDKGVNASLKPVLLEVMADLVAKAPECPATGPDVKCVPEIIKTETEIPVPVPFEVKVPANIDVLLDYKNDAGFIHEGSLVVLKAGENWSFGGGVYAGFGRKSINRRFQADLGVDTGRQVLDLESFYGSEIDVTHFGAIAQLMKEGRGKIHLGGRLGVGYESLNSSNTQYQTATDSATREEIKRQECYNATSKTGGIHAFVDAIVEAEIIKNKLSIVGNGGVSYHGANSVYHGADNQTVQVMPRVTKRFGVGVKLRL